MCKELTLEHQTKDNATKFGNLSIEEGQFGQTLVVKGDWDDRYIAFMQEHDLKELCLNGGNGFTGKSLNFLRGLPFLEGLFIFVSKSNDSIANILELEKLRSFTNSSYDRTSLDFTLLPNLERLSVGWHEGVRSIFECRTLQRLRIGGYNGRSLRDFAKLRTLKALDIVSRTIESLDGIDELRQLEELDLWYASKLTSLQNLQFLVQLKKFTIEACKKISSIKEVQGLEQLELLGVINCGDIDSLQYIRDLKRLRRLSFIESTNILDGNLDVLLELPNLEMVLFQNRKHYSLKREIFPPWNANP
jgi:hypothetical protein